MHTFIKPNRIVEILKQSAKTRCCSRKMTVFSKIPLKLLGE